MKSRPILALENVASVYGGGKPWLGRAQPEVRAVDGVTFDVHEGEALALVGESGCGKTTLAKTVLGLLRERSGDIRLDGKLVSGLSPQQARLARMTIQYVHQDPGAALRHLRFVLPLDPEKLAEVPLNVRLYQVDALMRTGSETQARAMLIDLAEAYIGDPRVGDRLERYLGMVMPPRR